MAKFHRTDSVICSYSREGKTLSYNQRNMVNAMSQLSVDRHKTELSQKPRGRVCTVNTADIAGKAIPMSSLC